MAYEKLGFLDAVADLAQRAGLEIPKEALGARDAGGGDLYEVMTQVARFFEQNLSDNPRGRDYLKGRGIDAGTAEQFALGYAPDSWNALLNRFGGEEDERRRLLQLGLIIERDTRGGERASGFYDRFRDRLMFPIRDSRGRVLGFGGRIIDQGEPKYLNSPETPLFHKGRELYGLYEARQAHNDFKRLMIVEGYMDVVRLHQAGITYAVATLGTATTQEHLNKLFRITSELVFCFDGDRAGRQAAWRALENALPLARDGRELKFMFLPDGHDPDTLVAEIGKESFEERLKASLSLSTYLIRELLQQVDVPPIDGRAQAKGTGATPVRQDAGGRVSGTVGRRAGRRDPHAGSQVEAVVAGRRAAQGGSRSPESAFRPEPTRQPPGSNQRWTRQSADSGDYLGPAPPLGGGCHCRCGGAGRSRQAGCGGIEGTCWSNPVRRPRRVQPTLLEKMAGTGRIPASGGARHCRPAGGGWAGGR